jgi:hypothetical protein
MVKAWNGGIPEGGRATALSNMEGIA